MSGFVNTRVTVNTGEILQGVGRITLDGRELGSFQGGVKVNYSQSEATVKSDFALGEVDSEITEVSMEVSTELEQATLENLATAWGMNSSSVASGTSSKVLNLIPSKSMLEKVLVVEGMSATNRQLIRTWTFGRAVKIGQSSANLQRGTKTTIPVTFKILLDTTGSFGSVVDKTV